MGEMAANGDGSVNRLHLPPMSSDIKEILNMPKYKILEKLYYDQEEKDYRSLIGTGLSKKIIEYCNLLKNLSNDEALWNTFYLRAMRNKSGKAKLRHLRLRYEIVGNVLKTIFVLHKKKERLVWELFKVLAVKIFMYPKSNKKVKVVVLQHLGNNEQRAIDNLRPPLPNLRIRRSRTSPISGRTENDAAFDALLNDTGRIAREVRPIEDIPIYGDDIRPIRQIQRGIEDVLIPEEEIQRIRRIQRGADAESSQYRLLRDVEELRRRWPRSRNPPSPIAGGSKLDDQFLHQLENNLQYLRESGFKPQDLRALNHDQLNEKMNELLELLGGSLVPPAIPAIREYSSRVSNVTPILPVTQPDRRMPENVVEPAERPNTQTEGRIPRTIADNLMQDEVIQHEFESAFLRGIGPPGSVVEIPLPDVPFNLEQRAPERSQSPPPRTLAELERENPEPPKKSPRKRKKYTFYTNLVISRKLQKIIKPPNFVPHLLRLENEYDEFRHPFNKIIPFDDLEVNQDDFSSNRRFNIAREELPTAPNTEDNMIYELFDENDDTYFEENELEARIANLRASMLVPIQEILRETSPPIFENVQTIEGNRMPELVVQPPIEDIQIPAQPQPENILSNIPVPEQRASARLSQGTNQPPTRISVQNEDLLQNQQPVDPRASFLQVPAEVAPIPDRVSMNVPQVEYNVLNIPTIDIPGTSIPPIQPTIHVVGAGINVEEIVQQKRGIEVDEGILPKRRRTTSPQGTVDIAQIPVQIEPQQIEQSLLLPQADPTVNEQQQMVQTSMFPQTDVVTETVPPPITQDELLRRRRERISVTSIQEKLDNLFDQSQEPVCFIELCNLTAEHTNEQKRKIIAKVLRIILDLVAMRKIKVDQEPRNWSPEQIWISRPEPQPTTSRPEPEPTTFWAELDFTTSGSDPEPTTPESDD